MVSLMDLGPKMLNILGVEIPDYMSGMPFIVTAQITNLINLEQ